MTTANDAASQERMRGLLAQLEAATEGTRELNGLIAEFVEPFHHKQNGGVRGKDAGCLVDGVEHKHFPAALAA